MLTLALLSGYAILLAFALHLLAAARRREELAVLPRPAAAAPRRLQRHEAEQRLAATLPGEDGADLGRLAAAVHDTLQIERVAVVVSDRDDPRTGVVAACLGVPGLLGNRVPVLSQPAAGLLGPGEVADLGLGDDAPDEEPWAFAQLPIMGTREPLGALTVASRRGREFDGAELRALERLAREEVPRFDRRSSVSPLRAIA